MAVMTWGGVWRMAQPDLGAGHPQSDRRPPRYHRLPVGLEGARAILRLRTVIDNGDYPDVLVMPTMRAGPAGGHGPGGSRGRDNLRPHLW